MSLPPVKPQAAANSLPEPRAAKRIKPICALDDARISVRMVLAGHGMSVCTWTDSASLAAGSRLPVQSFDVQRSGRYLIGECPALAAQDPPPVEYGLQWAGECCLQPGQFLGKYSGLCLSETTEEEYSLALMKLLAPFGGLAPSRYCLALRCGTGWQLVDALESPQCWLKYANSSRGTPHPPTFSIGEDGRAHALAAGRGLSGALEPSASSMSLHSRLTWDYEPLLSSTLPVPRPRLRLAARLALLGLDCNDLAATDTASTLTQHSSERGA